MDIFKSIASEMDNMGNIWDLLLFVYHYIANNVVAAGTITVAVLYFFGYLLYKEIKTNRKDLNYGKDYLRQKYRFVWFNKVNRILDVAVALLPPKKVNLLFFKIELLKPAEKFLSRLISNHIIDSAFSAMFKRSSGILNGSYDTRLEEAKSNFGEASEAFMYEPEIAPDFKSYSPIIFNRWFNGKPIKDYLPLFFHPNNFYQIVRRGMVVFACTFVLFSAAYNPSVYFGYHANSFKEDVIVADAKAIIENPSLVPELRHDHWTSSDEEQNALQDKAIAIAQDKVANADGYPGLMVLFKGGYLAAFFLALATSLAYMRRMTTETIKKIGVPVIEGMPEEELHNAESTDIDNFKKNLYYSNKRATGYDRSSELLPLGKSSGSFEKKGIVSAQRKGKIVALSVLDMSQNVAVFGGVGENKTRGFLTPMAKNIFFLYNKYAGSNKAYEKYYDMRRVKPICNFDENGKWTGEGVNPYNFVEVDKPLMRIAMWLTDIKAELWKTLQPVAIDMKLKDLFRIIGAEEDQGEFSVDLLAKMNPEKLVAFLKSLNRQLGGQNDGDFWSDSALIWIRHFANIAYLFNRTEKGEKYTQQYEMKPWSLGFIHKLVVVDSDAFLVTHAVLAILDTIQKHPERLADIINPEMMDSIKAVVSDWHLKNLGATETKAGVQVNINKTLDGMNNSKMKSFLSGIGKNSMDIGEAWHYLIAINLDTTKYSILGKVVNILLKSLLQGEAVARQQTFSGRIVEINNEFLGAYPDVLKGTAAVELAQTAWLDPIHQASSLAAYNTFRGNCIEIMSETGSTPLWKEGEYESKLDELIADGMLSVDMLKLANEAKSAATRFRQLEPRLSEQSTFIKDLNPAMFATSPTDMSKEAQKKRQHMLMYYEYVDLSDKLNREHMFFVADEFQELISVDPAGGVIYTETNFPNISRSTNFKYIVAAQTKNAYISRVGNDDAENFLNQMRTQIFLPTEDEKTIEFIEKLIPKVDVIKNNVIGSKLKIDGVETDYVVYNYFNAYISELVSRNQQALEAGLSIEDRSYPYDHDIFTTLDPIEVDLDKVKVSNAFTAIFETDDDPIYVPKMINHFYSSAAIPSYRGYGSLASGIQDNRDNIQSSLASAKKDMDSQYQEYRAKSFKGKETGFNASEYGAQGSNQAVVIYKRAGTTNFDQIVLMVN